MTDESGFLHTGEHWVNPTPPPQATRRQRLSWWLEDNPHLMFLGLLMPFLSVAALLIVFLR